VTVYLSLGSNLGDRAANLRAGLAKLDGEILQITQTSSVYETGPVGITPERVPDYLNLATRAETSLAPEALLRHTQSAELALGREPTYRWGPRVIDIDILLYGDERIDTPRLTIPHPRMMERAFVLIPLREIAPELIPADAVESPTIQNQSVRILST